MGGLAAAAHPASARPRRRVSSPGGAGAGGAAGERARQPVAVPVSRRGGRRGRESGGRRSGEKGSRGRPSWRPLWAAAPLSSLRLPRPPAQAAPRAWGGVGVSPQLPLPRWAGHRRCVRPGTPGDSNFNGAGKGKALPQGRNSPGSGRSWGPAGWKAARQGRSWRSWWAPGWTCALAAKKLYVDLENLHSVKGKKDRKDLCNRDLPQILAPNTCISDSKGNGNPTPRVCNPWQQPEKVTQAVKLSFYNGRKQN
ncbi:collagen alpha-2(I) chain-like [Chroicocephalus ridibundus]|uniref:collagen alpha-2(I) chain-like n=1 Tax=Chroicocephalus ridibundus TaxID=1192867 RepID=UPI002FDED815